MKWVDRCLTSLEEVKVDHDVVVVDNLSTDGTQDYIKKHYPNVIFYQNKENTGFGAANNIGLQMALDKGYDYVYLLNQDAWIKEGCIEELITVQKKHPEYGVISPFQVQANMKSLDNNFARNVCSYQANKDLVSDLYFNNRKDIYEVPFVMAAHWLISRECLKQVGGFSPSFHHYGEDDNYLERVNYHGFKIGISPLAIGVHDRADRKPTQEQNAYMKFSVEPIKFISNPNHIFKGLILMRLKENIIYSIRHLDMRTMKYAFNFVFNIRTMLLNRSASQTKRCAFLDLTNHIG